MNTATIVIPHDSKSAIYALIRATLDGFRAATDNPAAIAVKLIEAAQAADTKAGAAAIGLAATVAGFPVAVASIGVSTVELIAKGEATLPNPGDMGYTIAPLNVRNIKATNDKGESETRNGTLALTIYPAHSVAAFGATAEGADWLQTIIDKEAGLIAFRSLRASESETVTFGDLGQSAEAMPLLPSDYTSRARASGDDSLATFNAIWKMFADFAGKQPSLAPVLNAFPSRKEDIYKAMRSKAYATMFFAPLESRNLFVQVAAILKAYADRTQAAMREAGRDFNFDFEIIARWIETREALDLTPQVKDAGADLDSLDLSAFLGTAATA